MKELSLDGEWYLQSGKELNGIEPNRVEYPMDGWIKAKVPGTVQEAYIEAGRLPHPFFEDNAKLWQALEEEIFWYRREFFVPGDFKGEKITLEFEGLDTYSTIYLNGKEIGKTSNAFVPFIFDVTQIIQKDAVNIIAVKFDSSIQKARKIVEENLDKKYLEIFGEHALHRVFLRRPQVSFGWDFAVRLINVGIWRNVKLRVHDKVSIEHVYVQTKSCDKKSAEIEVEIQLTKNTNKAETVNIYLPIGRPEGWTGKKEIVKFWKNEKSKTIKIPITIKNPKLWYPHNIGKPNLYEVKVYVKSGAKLLDSRIEKFGIRIIKIVNKVEGENRFTFNVNGIDIFCKGANWVPGDSITTDISPEKYQFFLEKAKDANMNMLRIWGGGIYEHDRFYELCDELGIMVWQDFPYACAMYPDENKEFMKNIEDESRKAVIRLRNHPSIVLWCGNNENQVGWANWGWKNNASRHYGEKIYDEVLPKICSSLDPSRPYHPGSPFGGENPNSYDEGDVHDWRIWHRGDPYTAFEDNTGRFISEYGLQGAPNLDTVKKYLSKTNQWPLNGLWKFHHLVPEKMEKYLGEFGKPNSVEEYVRLTQLAQAQTYKFAIESFRRRKFHCSGSLFWQYNDPWPTMCWSILDYYNKPKASYFWSKNAYRQILPVFKENKNGSLELWIINDELKPVKGKLEIIHQDFQGKFVDKLNITVEIPANSSQKIESNLLEKFKIKNRNSELVRCRLIIGKMEIGNVYYFVPFKDLKLIKPEIKIWKTDKNNKTQLILKSDKLVRFVQVQSTDGDLWFSDNYFDIYPGESKVITASGIIGTQIRVEGMNVEIQFV